MNDTDRSELELRHELARLRQQIADLEAREARHLEADETLRQQAQIIDQIHDSVISTDLNGLVTGWNRGAERLYGYTAAEAVGRHIGFIYPAEEHEYLENNVIRPLLENGEHETTIRVQRKSGEVFFAHLSLSLIRDSSGTPTGMIGYSLDITEQQRAEDQLRQYQARLEDLVAVRTAALQESEERFRLAFENANTGIALVGLDGQLLRVNNQFCEIFGYSKSEMERMTVNTIAHPDDTEISPHYMEQALDDKIIHFRFEKKYLHHDGHLVWGAVSSSLVHDATGAPLYFISQVQDITEQKAAEEAIRRNTERYALATAAGQVGVWDWDLTTNAFYVDPNLKTILGYADHEIRNHLDDWGQHVHPDDIEAAMEVMEAHITSRVPHFETTWRMVHRDGGIRWFLVRGTAIRDEHGVTSRMIGTGTDITELVKARNALRESEERFRSLVNAMDDVVFTLDREQRHTGVYGRWLETSQTTPEMFLGHTAREIMGVEAARVHEEANTRALAGENVAYEWELPNPDGTTAYFQTVLSPIWDEQTGEVARIVGVGRNITAVKEAEQRALELAIERERVAVLQRFIGDMSHDLRTPLSSMLFSLAVARRSPDQEVQRRHFTIIETQIAHLERLLEELLNMVRMDRTDAIQRLPLDLNALTEAVITEHLSLIERKRHRVTFVPEEGRLIVEADGEKLKRAAGNILLNALNYTPDGGQITIRTARQPGQIALSVQDNGPGIAARDLPHLFKRFFRADAARNADTGGLGLGLSLAQKIVEAHEGYIAVESVEGAGSTFTIYLPDDGSQQAV